MEIVYNEGQLASYVESASPPGPSAPLLVDKYHPGLELEVDAAFDGEDILIPGVFEHIERAGIHSGDSISVYPTQTIEAKLEQQIADVTKAIAAELGIRGLLNIQFVYHEGELFVLEANPRASRTVPVISKATGINLVAAATRIALGERLRDMPFGLGLRPHVPFVVVKVPVFSFAKMRGVETILGPEMKSTGEVLGIDETFPGALRKAFEGAGFRMPRKGGRLVVSVSEKDTEEAAGVLGRYARLGYTVLATPATHEALKARGVGSESAGNVLDLVAHRTIDLVINTVTGTREAADGYRIRRAAAEANIACLTSIDTAAALAHALEHPAGSPKSLQEYHALAAASGVAS